MNKKAEQLSSRKRVLLITQSSAKGGVENHLINLIVRMNHSEVEPIILCYGKNPFSEMLSHRNGVPVKIDREVKPNNLFAFRQSFLKYRPDIIVFVSGHQGMFPWFAYAAARLAGFPRVVDILQKDPNPRLRRTTASSRKCVASIRRYISRARISALFCHTIICVSETMRGILIREYKYPKHKTVAVQNGVNLRYFETNNHSELHTREEGPFASADPLLVCVARLVPPKALDVLLKALAIVLKRYPRCKCLIIGDGPLEHELRTMCDVLGIASAVEFVGHVEDVRPYLTVSDMFVLSSYWEGLPLSLSEAMACGLPCVATDVGGNRELVIPGETGLIVPSGSPEQFAEAVLYLAEHKEERIKMGLNGRKRVEQWFDMEKTMAKLNSLLLDEGILIPDQSLVNS